ncbi:transposase [Streptococcus pneumoniae]|nr:transposase [Streptococcus pneumoniae]
MSFIAQDFNNLNIITVLEGRTQAIIRNHFLRYDRAVRCRVKIITMDMFSPYYDLAKQLRFHIVQHLSRAMSRVRVHFECNFRNLPKIMSWDVETVRGVTVSIGRWR